MRRQERAPQRARPGHRRRGGREIGSVRHFGHGHRRGHSDRGGGVPGRRNRAAGRVTVHEGDYVKAATSDPLVTIIQPDPIRVRFAIPEREVPLLQRYRSGNPRVEIESDGGSRVIPGTLVFVDNAVDPGSGTLLLKGEVRNQDGRLVPGQFVDVRLVLFVAPKSLVIPARAVSVGQQGPYVYVVKADSTVASRPVEVERTRDETSIIARGLSAGETVGTDGQPQLAPGAKVSVRPSIEDAP